MSGQGVWKALRNTGVHRYNIIWVCKVHSMDLPKYMRPENRGEFQQPVRFQSTPAQLSG